MKYYGATDQGAARSNNEDSFYADRIGEYGCFIVADGMGGHNAGEVASALAVNTVPVELLVSLPHSDDPTQAITHAVRTANLRIFRKAAQNEAMAGMGTTIDVCLLKKGGMLYTAHVGDSRVYLYREGELTCLTSDHSWVNELLHHHQITREQALNHPLRNVITRALGTEQSVKIDTITTTLKPLDRILLCTDGVMTMMSDEEIKTIMQKDTPKAVVDTLIRRANQHGGDDNITAVAVWIEEADVQ